MRIDYTGRNIRISPALRKQVRDKLDQAAGFSETDHARVTLTVQKRRHVAEIIIDEGRSTITGKAWSGDMFRSIQKAVERLETQVLKRRAKRVSRKRRSGKPDLAITPTSPESRPSAPRVTVEKLDRIKPITVEEAVLLLDTAKRPFVSFRNAETGRFAVVYRKGDTQFGLIEPED